MREHLAGRLDGPKRGGGVRNSKVPIRMARQGLTTINSPDVVRSEPLESLAGKAREAQRKEGVVLGWIELLVQPTLPERPAPQSHPN